MNFKEKFIVAYLISLFMCLCIGFAFKSILVAFGLIIILSWLALEVSFNFDFTTETTTPKKIKFTKLEKHIAIEMDNLFFTFDDNNRLFYKLTEDNKHKVTMTIKRDYWGSVNERIVKLNDDDEWLEEMKEKVKSNMKDGEDRPLT